MASHEDALPTNLSPLPKSKAKRAKKRKAAENFTEPAEEPVDTPATKYPKRAPAKPKPGRVLRKILWPQRASVTTGKGTEKQARRQRRRAKLKRELQMERREKGKAAKHATPEEVEEVTTPAKKGSKCAKNETATKPAKKNTPNKPAKKKTSTKPAKTVTKPSKARSEAHDFPPQQPDEELVQSFTSIFQECGEVDYEESGLDIHTQRFCKLGVRLNIYWTRHAVGLTVKDPSATKGKKDKVYFSTPTSTIATHLQAAQWVAPHLQDVF